MGKFLGSTALEYLWEQIKALFATKTEVSAKADVENVLFPNFDDMTPVKVIEFDKATSAYSVLFTRTNSNISSTMSEVQDVVLMRITVTGTNIYSRSDVVIKFQPGVDISPHAYAFHHTTSNAAATTGIRNLRLCRPKTLNNGYDWLLDVDQYNTTSRHYKVEVFATTENITWVTALTATTYNSTYQNNVNMTLYTTRGLCTAPNMPITIGGNATAAAYVNGYQNKYIGNTPIRAGEALVTYDIVFNHNGFAYKIGNKSVSIDPEYGICSIGTSYAVNGNIGYAYLRTVSSFTFTAPTGHGLTYEDFAQGDKVYLRCTMQDGKIYSDAHLAKEMSPGYTWYLLGAYVATNGLTMNTEGSMFITLDDAGCISYINGKPTQATLMTEGVVQENTFLKRSGAPAGNAEVKDIKGNSIVWNQMASTYANANSTITGTIDNLTMLASARYGHVRLTLGSKVLAPDIYVSGHKYYVTATVKSTSNEIQVGSQNSGGSKPTASAFPTKNHSGSGEWEKFQYIVNGGAVGSSYYAFVVLDMRTSDWDNVYVKDIMLFDLTQMFGSGNEPATVEEFEKLFPEPYYEYDTGTLLNLEMTGIKTEDGSGTEVDSETFNVKALQGIASGGSTAETIFPNGMCGMGSVQDEIDFEAGKAIKRFGVVDLGTLTWVYTSGNGGKFYHNPLSSAKPTATNGDLANMICAKYATDKDSNSNNSSYNNIITLNSTSILSVKDNNYNDAALFKTAMSGVYLVYELATPVEYTITATAPTYTTAKGGVEKVLPYDDDDVLTAPISAAVHYENTVQEKLISGTNIKTINNESILGSGNITIQGGGSGDVNVIEIIKVNNTALTPDSNKAVNVTVPTDGSGLLYNDSNYSNEYNVAVGDTIDDCITELDNAVYDKQPKPLIIEVDDTDTTVPSGTYASITAALAAGREVICQIANYNDGEGEILVSQQLIDYSSIDNSYLFVFSGWSYNKNFIIKSNDTCESETIYLALEEHQHGHIDSDGNLCNTDETISNGDKLVIVDISDSNKIRKTSIAFDGSTTTKALTQKGTWETFLKSAPVTSVNNQTGAVSLALGDTNVIEAITFNGNAVSVNSKTAAITYSAPVTSVNGNTGAVTITPGDANVIEAITFNGNAVSVSSKTAAITASIPTKVSDLTNDSGFITGSSVVTIYSGSTTPSSSLGNNGDIYVKTSS